MQGIFQESVGTLIQHILNEILNQQQLTKIRLISFLKKSYTNYLKHTHMIHQFFPQYQPFSDCVLKPQIHILTYYQMEYFNFVML